MKVWQNAQRGGALLLWNQAGRDVTTLRGRLRAGRHRAVKNLLPT
jgi:hypothetical protein